MLKENTKMSQAKVDRYKEQKANRKAIMKREKRKKFLTCVAAVIVCVVVVGFIGYSGYKRYEASQPRASYEVDFSSIDNYLAGLDSEE